MSPRSRPALRRSWQVAFIVALLTTLLVVPAWRTFGLPTAPLTFRGWQSADGLPDDKTSDIVQSADGYLWVATYGGVARFDGVRFVAMTSPKLPSGGRTMVRILFATRDGNVWGGFDHGIVARWKRDELSVFTPGQGMPDDPPVSMCEDKQGNLWIGFPNEGIVKITGNQVTRFGSAEGVAPKVSCSVAASRDGQVWAAMGSHLTQFRKGKFEPITTLRQSTGRSRLATAQTGGIWVVDRRSVRHMNAARKFDSEMLLPPDTRSVTAVLEDTKGTVWIGTPNEGLFRSVSQSLLVPVDLPDRYIAGMTLDREGNLWVATSGSGIKKIHPALVRSLRMGVAMGKWWQSMTKDTTNAVWVVMSDGELVRFNGDRWQQMAPFTGPPNSAATCVAATPDGSVYVATRSMGLLRWKGGEMKPVTTVGKSQLACLLPGSDGDIWIGTGDGKVTRVRGDEATEWHLPAGLQARYLTMFPGGIIASGTGHIFRIKEERVQELPLPNGESIGPIRVVLADKKENLWIGFGGNGLGRWRNGKLQRVTVADGLPDDFISQLLQDDAGQLWIGSNRGLARMDPADFDAYVSGASRRLRVMTYARTDEDFNVQVNRGPQPTCFRAANGELWFAARDRAIIVNPVAQPPNDVPPPVILESFRMNDREMQSKPDSNGIVHLPPNHTRLEFRYTALSFTSPENVDFRYQLEGVDPEWVETGTNRQAIYSHLEPGRYRFKVIACNNDGLWNEAGASIGFVVDPFYWQTVWFRSVVLAGVALLGILAYRRVALLRIRRQLEILEGEQALARERVRIARDMHDDLGSRLIHLSLLGKLAQGKHGSTEEKKQHVREMAESAVHLVKTLDQLVWSVNPKNDTLPELASYFSQYAVDFLKAANIRCLLDFSDDLPEVTVAAPVRHNLILAFREALHNLAKHAQATEANFQLVFQPPLLRIGLEDNGRGFVETNAHNGGNGLQNMRERLRTIGGNFTIENRPEGGTRILFELTLEKSAVSVVPS